MPVYQNKGGYLLVEVSEPYSLNLMLAIIQEIADRCGKEGQPRALVDFRNMPGNPGMLDRYTFGAAVAQVVGPRIKVASVARAEVINGMGETVAINRGAHLMVFTDMQEALDWLSADP